MLHFVLILSNSLETKIMRLCHISMEPFLDCQFMTYLYYFLRFWGLPFGTSLRGNANRRYHFLLIKIWFHDIFAEISSLHLGSKHVDPLYKVGFSISCLIIHILHCFIPQILSQDRKLFAILHQFCIRQF